jgi:hypothetical protein
MRVKFFSLVFVLLSFGMVAQAQNAHATAVKPDCGKYTLHEWPFNGGYSCQRYATYPWFAAQTNLWTTQISIANGSQTAGVQFEIGLGEYANTKLIWGGNWINTISSLVAISLGPNGSDLLTYTKMGVCSVVNGAISCGTNDDLAYGTMFVRISAPNVKALEEASSQLVFFHYTDGLADWQAPVEMVYNDQASPKWSATFTETPVGLKGGNVQSNNSSFAVTNLSDQPQSVLVSVYDTRGKLVASASTPVLQPSSRDMVHNEEIYAGGVYAAVLSDFFGNTILVDAAGMEYFRGTIIFEGSANGNIVPIVLRAVGASMSPMFVKAVQQ